MFVNKHTGNVTAYNAYCYTDMIGNGFGHIVNVISLAGKIACFERSSYCSAKFGIMGLMDCIRHEVK